MEGLVFRGQFSNIQEREYEKDWELKTAYDAWFKMLGKNQKIAFTEKPKLEKNKQYQVEIWINVYEVTDEESGEVKLNYSLYCPKDTIIKEI